MNVQSFLMKILVAGETFVGKTALIQRYVADQYIAGIKNTIGVDFFLKQITRVQFEGLRKGDQIDLQIWDISGESRFREILPLYTQGTSGIVYCFDTNENLKKLEEWETFLSRLVPSTIPRILFRTKMDLDLDVDQQLVESIIKKYNFAGYYGTSAKKGTGVNSAFVSLARIIYERIVLNEDEDKNNL